MANFSRKIRKSKKQKKVTSPIKNVFEFCPVELDNNFKFTIEITSYNANYFSDTTKFINSYGLVIHDYKNYCNMKGCVDDFIEFLKDSVENNPYLCDSLNDMTFKVENNHIRFNLDGDEMDFINMGEFYIDYYKINVCNSYLFITDTLEDKQYMYYGD